MAITNALPFWLTMVAKMLPNHWTRWFSIYPSNNCGMWQQLFGLLETACTEPQEPVYCSYLTRKASFGKVQYPKQLRLEASSKVPFSTLHLYSNGCCYQLLSCRDFRCRGQINCRPPPNVRECILLLGNLLHLIIPFILKKMWSSSSQSIASLLTSPLGPSPTQ